MHDWVKLTTRLGVDVQGPTLQDMQTALHELFTSARDNEHPDCWLECGSGAGPLYTFSIFQSGHGIFSKYSDADMSKELISKRIEALDVESSLRLWQALIHGRFAEI